MGSGKSSVGRCVAETLQTTFVDLDEAVMASAGIPIAQYFEAHGEASFRERECDVLREVLARKGEGEGFVLSLGGGTLESGRAREVLREMGGLIYLDIDAEPAWERSRNTGRPLAIDEVAFRTLHSRRRRIYEEAADWVLPVGRRTVEELGREIAALIGLTGDAWPTLWGRRLKGTQRPSVIVGGVGALRVLGTRGRAVLETGRRLFVITDSNVADAWGEEVCDRLGVLPSRDMLVFEPGEATKNSGSLARCWDWLAGAGARRDDVVIALGGGVIGDLAGFAAATYQRGVELWQVPTTLLAQVDSSIGGKTAIDLSAGKNLVGAFYQPDLVLIDPVTLTTLARVDFMAGLGEVVKHALLTSTSAFERLEGVAENLAARDLATISSVVRESVGIKARFVEQDERERGMRAVLNLGHTVGHALELVSGYGRLSHGAAVALGLQVSLAVSEDLLGLDPNLRSRVKRLCEVFGLPTRWTLPDVERLVAATSLDKKARAGSSGFVGLRAPGEPVWDLNVPPQQLASRLEVIRE